MAGIYYTDLLDVLRAAGCQVAESSTTNGWQRRARSSGGFPFAPLGVQWHHTASSTSPANDLSYMINGNSDAPVGNLLLDRTGTYWPIAAGAANTAGKGGPLAMSRGTITKDQANSQTFAIEAANNGVGESWPTAQTDAYFTGSNALNARFGNLPSDVFNHNTWAPTRKIDPATAPAIAGAFSPRSSTSSGTWMQADVTAECLARASSSLIPEGDDMTDEQAAQLARVLECAEATLANTNGTNATLWGNTDDPPFPLSVNGQLQTISTNLTGVLATLWGNTDDPPWPVSMFGRFDDIVNRLQALAEDVAALKR